MKKILVTDVHPGAKFQQPGSTIILVVDRIDDNGTVFFYNLDGDVKINEQSEQFSSFVSSLNMLGYENYND